MNHTTAFWLGILIGGIVGATLGFILCAVLANRRIHEAQNETEKWKRRATLRREALIELEDECIDRDASIASLYNELLYEVTEKFPGESRHATALRYIREAERVSSGPAQDAARRKAGGDNA
jgi:gas vesicle protein